jgi:peptide/nickel transport system substrate-binding protein
MLIEANDRYVLGRPKIDEIEIKFVLDTNTLMANILAGALDLSLGRQAVNAEQAIVIRDQWKDGIVDAPLVSVISLHPQFTNPDPPVLLEVRFRRALLHALNRQQIVDSFLGGLVPVADSTLSPDDLGYREVQPRIVRYGYDPRRSIELLDGLGLSKGPDGIYRDATNRPLSVQVSTRTNPLREKLQQVIADDWRGVGIIAESSVVPEQRIRDRAYTPERPAFYFRGGNPDQFVDWTSDQAPVAQNNHVGANSIRYQNPEYDTLVERFVTTIPSAERMRVLGDIVHHATDQLLLLTMFHDPVPALISNRLVNVTGRRGISLQARNAHEWDVR